MPKLQIHYPFLICCIFLPFLTIASAIQGRTQFPTSSSTITGGLAWSPDGSQIAVGTNDGVWIHQVGDLTQVRHVIEANNIGSVAWHPTENWLATGSRSPQQEDPLRIWDAQTGQLLHVLAGHQFVVNSVKWSPDGRYLASDSWDETIRIWSASDPEDVVIISTPEATSGPLMDWSPDSRSIVTMHEDNISTYRTYIYDAESGQETLSWDFAYYTVALEWSPSGRFIAGIGPSRDDLVDIIRIWDASSGKHLNSIRIDGQSLAIQWSPDEARFVLQLSTLIDGEYYDRLMLIDAREEEILAETRVPVYYRLAGEYPNALAYSPDGTQIASISDDGRLLLFNSDDLTLLDSFDGYRSILLEDTGS